MSNEKIPTTASAKISGKRPTSPDEKTPIVMSVSTHRIITVCDVRVDVARLPKIIDLAGW